MASRDDSKVFVGIDCGTTYSGFCFAVGRESKDYHVQPQAGADGQKIPTALLLKKDGSLCAFGQHAIDEYSTLDDAEKKELLFFDRFKMELFSAKSTGSSIQLKAANGLSLPATTIFARILEYFRKQAETNVGRRTGVEWRSSEVKWIVTVPAIWGDRAKEVMKAAAVQARLTSSGPSENFDIIIEPHAVGVACLEEIQSVWRAAGRPDTLRYIVADCGGGTVDVAVHDRRLTESGQNAISEVIRPCGGPWGGAVVDQKILELIKSFLGDHAKHVDEATWRQLERGQVERAKRDAFVSDAHPTQVKIELCPEIVTSLASAGVDLKTVLSSVAGVDYRKRAGAVIVSIDLFENCFDEPCRKIVQHLRKILDEVKPVHCLMLAGGFSESVTLRRRLESELRRTRIINAADPSLAVVRGAVMFGQNPQVMQRVPSRRARQSSEIPLQPRSQESMAKQMKRYAPGVAEVQQREEPKPPSIPNPLYTKDEKSRRNPGGPPTPSIANPLYTKDEKSRRNPGGPPTPSIPNPLYTKDEKSHRNPFGPAIPSIANPLYTKDPGEPPIPSIANPLYSKDEKSRRNPSSSTASAYHPRSRRQPPPQPSQSRTASLASKILPGFRRRLAGANEPDFYSGRPRQDVAFGRPELNYANVDRQPQNSTTGPRQPSDRDTEDYGSSTIV